MALGKTGWVAWIIGVLAAVTSMDDATRALVTEHVDAILAAISALILIARKYTSAPVVAGILGWLGVREGKQP